MPLGGLLPYGDEQEDEYQDGYDMPVMLTAGDITDQQDQLPQGDQDALGMPPIPPGGDVLARLFGRKRMAPMAGQTAQGGEPNMPPMAGMGAALMKGYRG